MSEGSAQSVKAGIVVIGDEILSGRTRDKNVQQIANFLQPLGVNIGEVRIVSDIQAHIVEAVRALSKAYDYVFTTGGIGPTHDDITADSIAAAFNRSIDIREDAREILVHWYAKAGQEVTDARLRMARIPDGASLIDNPVTGAPGFQIENVFVMAGVPSIVRGMLEDIAHRIEGGAVTHSINVQLENIQESEISDDLAALEARHEGVCIGSYPYFDSDGKGGIKRGVVLVARGTQPHVLAKVQAQMKALG